MKKISEMTFTEKLSWGRILIGSTGALLGLVFMNPLGIIGLLLALAGLSSLAGFSSCCKINESCKTDAKKKVA